VKYRIYDDVSQTLTRQLDVKGDEMNIISRGTENKLRKLPNKSKVIAEKPMDIVLEAETGNVNRRTNLCLVNGGAPSYYTPLKNCGFLKTLVTYSSTKCLQSLQFGCLYAFRQG
jgi:hypothetical protein